MIGMIPCAGYGTRLAPLTDTVLKPLIEIGGKSLVAHNLDLLRALGLSRVVLIISLHTEDVRSSLGPHYQGITIEYVEQDPPQGLLDAVCQARGQVEDRFITVLSDEVYAGCRHKDLVEYWQAYSDVDGIVGYVGNQDWDSIKKNYSVEMDSENLITGLIEKPRHQVNSLLGTGTWALTRSFFDYADLVLTKNPPDQRSFVDALQLMVKDNQVIQGYDLAGQYINVNYLDDVAAAERLLGRAAE